MAAHARSASVGRPVDAALVDSLKVRLAAIQCASAAFCWRGLGAGNAGRV